MIGEVSVGDESLDCAAKCSADDSGTKPSLTIQRSFLDSFAVSEGLVESVLSFCETMADLTEGVVQVVAVDLSEDGGTSCFVTSIEDDREVSAVGFTDVVVVADVVVVGNVTDGRSAGGSGGDRETISLSDLPRGTISLRGLQ